MTWIRTVAPQAATGKLARVYQAAIRRAGRVFGIVRAQSLEPHILLASGGIYQAVVLHPDSPLPRWFRELIGVTVSRLNDCHY
ncbi:MAG TPA: hypothetical protein ENK10_03360 [Acidobacteria bacterium]|nr:hypothetical protein [Acidobacteriota bacterium]